jgi:response regulator NasT
MERTPPTSCEQHASESPSRPVYNTVEQGSPAEGAACGQHFRVLIVEDEFLLASNLKTQVEALQHQVVGIAETGIEAIAMVERIPLDLVLMDVQLPELDGISAAKIIAQRGIPVVVISAFSDRGYIEGAAEAGVMMYLIKPVSLGDLRAVIDLTMARYTELQALRQEVGTLKQALEHRKKVERAKGILMEQFKLSEREAFRRLQTISQRENRPMIEVANAVITAFAVFSDDECPAS